MAEQALLEVRGLKKYFPVRSGVFNRATGQIRVVEDVSFSVDRRKTFALVGESGCGKTTTGRTLLRLLEPSGGTVRLDGLDVFSLGEEELRKARRKAQMIFQNPYGSLNPRMKVRALLGEPLTTHTDKSAKEIDGIVLDMMDKVGLAPEYRNRYPHQFSGGQRQRIAIARALICGPSLVVADEPVSALDVSIQSQIINLMMRLQEDLDLTYVFISHDLNVVRHISDHVGVMYLGRLVERSATEELFRTPRHPYTQALLSAVPSLSREKRKDRILLTGDVPNPAAPPSGCVFHPRCRRAEARCRSEIPALRELPGGSHVACHLC